MTVGAPGGLAGIAFCPHPPLLIPALAAGAAGELDDLRAACDVAVGTLLATRPAVVLLVTGDPRTGLDVPQPVDVGRWLLARAGWDGPVRTDTGDVALVLGDGSACRSTAAPGYFDPRAEPFDAAVAAALATADHAALAALDPPPELLVSGVTAWRAAAGFPGPWRGELHYDAAPYGVGYFVATWTRA